MFNRKNFRLIIISIVFLIFTGILYKNDIKSYVQSYNVPEGEVINLSDSIMYLPSNYKEQSIIFSPSGSANESIAFWKILAEKYQFIIYASSLYRNGLYLDNTKLPLENTVYESIRKFTTTYKIDTKKIIYSGLSGGGSFSYYMTFKAPSIAYGLIINTGRMWESEVYEPIMQNIESVEQKILSPPKIAFIASPTDFRYSLMQRDKILNIWIEFSGGHTLAPYEI